MKGDRERCLTAGMDSYVSKPVQAKELFAVIEEVVPGFNSAKKQEPEQQETAPAEKPSEPVLDESALEILINGDQEFLAELVTIFVADYPALLASVREAIISKDAQALSKSAHALKGSVSNFSARGAMHAALRLEVMGRNNDLKDAAEACEGLETELKKLQKTLEGMVEKSRA
jgi:HPt (histidine-containing phosphotransfer) domain-containing protein